MLMVMMMMMMMMMAVLTRALLTILVLSHLLCLGGSMTPEDQFATVQFLSEPKTAVNDESSTLDIAVSFRGQEIKLDLSYTPLLPVTSSSGHVVKSSEPQEDFEAGVFTYLALGTIVIVKKSADRNYTLSGIFQFGGQEWSIEPKADGDGQSGQDSEFLHMVQPSQAMETLDGIVSDAIVRENADPEVLTLSERNSYFKQLQQDGNKDTNITVEILGPGDPDVTSGGGTKKKNGSQTEMRIINLDPTEKDTDVYKSSLNDSEKPGSGEVNFDYVIDSEQPGNLIAGPEDSLKLLQDPEYVYLKDMTGGRYMDDGKVYTGNSYYRRRRRAAFTRYVVEVGFTVDNGDYLRWQANTPEPSDVIAEIQVFYTYIGQLLNYRFQTIYDPTFGISTKTVYLRVHTSPEDDGWVSLNSQQTLDPEEALTSFLSWYLNPTNNFPLADHHVWFTGYPLPDDRHGLAFVRKMCTTGSVSLVSSQLTNMTGNIAAHELRHSLGARHGDRDDADCSDADQSGSGTPDGGRGDVLPPERQQLQPLWLLPSCSVTGMRDYLNSVSCVKPEEITDTRAIDPSDQCAQKVGTGSSYCRLEQDRQGNGEGNICTNLYCRSLNQAGTCETITADDFTQCGTEMWCQGGNCVSALATPTGQTTITTPATSLMTGTVSTTAAATGTVSTTAAATGTVSTTAAAASTAATSTAATTAANAETTRAAPTAVTTAASTAIAQTPTKAATSTVASTTTTTTTPQSSSSTTRYPTTSATTTIQPTTTPPRNPFFPFFPGFIFPPVHRFPFGWPRFPFPPRFPGNPRRRFPIVPFPRSPFFPRSPSFPRFPTFGRFPIFPTFGRTPRLPGAFPFPNFPGRPRFLSRRLRNDVKNRRSKRSLHGELGRGFGYPRIPGALGNGFSGYDGAYGGYGGYYGTDTSYPTGYGYGYGYRGSYGPTFPGAPGRPRFLSGQLRNDLHGKQPPLVKNRRSKRSLHGQLGRGFAYPSIPGALGNSGGNGYNGFSGYGGYGGYFGTGTSYPTGYGYGYGYRDSYSSGETNHGSRFAYQRREVY